MSVMALSEVAENYFSTLNPIAERISEDIEAIRDAYEDLWRCLSQHEKDQIINETVIYPEAILKYALNSKSSTYDIASLDILYDPPRITGSKYIVDETTGLTWRDEHSGPFSWKTPSQIDLSIFGSKSHADADVNPEVICNNKINKSKRELINSEKIWNNDNSCLEAKSDKNGVQKIIETPDSPNVVLGGTCSKISGLCSKLKFLPGKSFSYEVKTVACPANGPTDINILEKLRASAVTKIQKIVGGKTHAADKKSEIDESENLVRAKESITIVRLQKPSPRVNKPKSPPPPPPPTALKSEKPPKKLTKSNDPENDVLLPDNSEHSLPSVDQDSVTYDLRSRVVHELSDEINSISTECTPLSGPSFDNIPKSGFDFLDNW